MKTYISNHLYACWINNDWSGSTDADQNLMAKWEKGLLADYPERAHFASSATGDDVHETNCEVSGCFDTCLLVEITLFLPVISVDGWREREGGWSINAAHYTGLSFPADLAESGSNRTILKKLRDIGILGPGSIGCVTIERDDSFITVLDSGSRKPLYQIALKRN